MKWAPLARDVLTVDAQRLDPYLRAAVGTGFADYGGITTFDVSIELMPGATAVLERDGLSVPPKRKGSRYLTANATLAAYNELAGSAESVRRVQFAAPIRTQRARPQPRDSQGPSIDMRERKRNDEDGTDPTGILLGIIDNGCPFAHRDLQRSHSPQPRVIRLWDQNARKHMAGLGQPPAKFAYGIELTRAELMSVMDAAETDGRVDEDQCYRLLGYEPVWRRTTHGAHLLGLMAGATQWDGRPKSSASPRVRGAADSVSKTADIVFVQLPQELMDAVSVASLEQRAYDGLLYIFEVGKELEYKKIIVSFGYESWVGPHNGTSWFESAVADLIESAGGKLEVHLSAGNAKERSAHAAFGESDEETLKLAIPPDCEVPTFMEIWVPHDSADGLVLEVSPPHASPLPALSWGSAVAYPATGSVEAAVVMEKSEVLGDNMFMILVRIAPTRCDDASRPCAQHGIWSFRLSRAGGSLYGIHAYVGRAEGDAGSPRRAHQARFVARSSAQSEADRKGTLNGHACGKEVEVVGAYYSNEFPYMFEGGDKIALRGNSTRYSGAGPGGQRKRPDASAPMEDGIYHAGVLGMGTRSACIDRLSGTSTAAPTSARLRADEPDPPLTRDRVAPKEPSDPGLGAKLLPRPGTSG